MLCNLKENDKVIFLKNFCDYKKKKWIKRLKEKYNNYLNEFHFDYKNKFKYSVKIFYLSFILFLFFFLESMWYVLALTSLKWRKL
jgi:hypothetical protein